MMEEGVIPTDNVEKYIELIEMPEDLKSKFQFYTYAGNQEDFITEIAKGNDLKMAAYVKRLIAEGK